MNEQAKEIERLNSELRRRVKSDINEAVMQYQRDVAIRENKRLQNELTEAKRAGTPYAAVRDTVNELILEIERLHKQVLRLSDSHSLYAEIERLNSELDQWRAGYKPESNVEVAG